MLIKSKGNKDKKAWMHPSRKKILDVMHGRDNGNAVVGWEAEKTERKVGDKWVDKDGKEWEQHEGFIARVTQMDDARNYISKLVTCKADDCKTTDMSRIHKKFIKQTGFCLNCLVVREAKMRESGVFQHYEWWKMNSQTLGKLKDDLARFEQARRDADTVPAIVNEDGTIEKWNLPDNIEQIRADMDTDIENIKELITKFQTAVDEDWEIIKEKHNEIFEH
jgi:hypothetical protein